METTIKTEHFTKQANDQIFACLNTHGILGRQALKEIKEIKKKWKVNNIYIHDEIESPSGYIYQATDQPINEAFKF